MIKSIKNHGMNFLFSQIDAVNPILLNQDINPDPLLMIKIKDTK
jgi:hypothetical protein